MKKKKIIVIECTEHQAFIIEQCLDSSSRMACGQLGEIADIISFMREECLKVGQMQGYGLGLYLERILKPLFFPDLAENASYGIAQKKAGKNSQIAYEMTKKLQNLRSKDYEGYSVLKHEPMELSTEPLIKVYEKCEKSKKR
jgi:hypothetical protein